MCLGVRKEEMGGIIRRIGQHIQAVPSSIGIEYRYRTPGRHAKHSTAVGEQKANIVDLSRAGVGGRFANNPGQLLRLLLRSPAFFHARGGGFLLRCCPTFPPLGWRVCGSFSGRSCGFRARTAATLLTSLQRCNGKIQTVAFGNQKLEYMIGRHSIES
jgi:hypothetical protein